MLQLPAPSPHLHTSKFTSQDGEHRWWHWPSMSIQVSLCSGCCKLVTALSCKTPKLPLCSGWSFHWWGNFSGCRKLSSFIGPSQGCRSHPNSFLSFFFLSLSVLPIYVKIFLPFQKSEVFCQHSVGILWGLFHMQMYLRCIWYICGMKWVPHPTAPPSWSLKIPNSNFLCL